MANKFQLKIEYEDHVVSEQLGKNKYARLGTAFGELIANSLDAKATRITVNTTENAMGSVETVTISDNGTGITPTVLNERFKKVGVRPMSGHNRFGKFGLGRFAAYRIGNVSDWVSTSIEDGKLVQVKFKMDSADPSNIDGEQSAIQNGETGTRITIYNLPTNEEAEFQQKKLIDYVLTQFISYLMANPSMEISVNGEKVDPASIVSSSRPQKYVVDCGAEKHAVETTHLMLKVSLQSTRFPAQVICCSKGKLVVAFEPEMALPNRYLALVDSPYFETLATSNRESVAELDETFEKIKADTLRLIGEQQKEYGHEMAQTFLQKARSEDFYPFKEAVTEPTAVVEKAIYDVFLEKIHEHTDLDKMTKKQRATVFKLLKRAMQNQNLFDVIEEVAALSDEDVAKFKELLKRTTLEAIIKMGNQVTDRLYFLEALHDLTYGDLSKKLKERSQLHLLLEPNCWLFGDKYHLATSDKSFRAVIERHRVAAGLPAIADSDVEKVTGVSLIPDLFLVASREFPVPTPQQHHLIIELKAPSVTLGKKEKDQIEKYAEVISESSEFDKQTTNWDLILVSSEVSKEIERDRNQKDRTRGLLKSWDRFNIWVFTWSEIITKAKQEMTLVREHLKLKTQDFPIAEYISKEFPFVNAPGEGKATPPAEPSVSSK